MDLFLFTVDPGWGADVVAAGGAGIVVDWERRGKHRRQLGEGTQINGDTPADLSRMRAATDGRLLCRVNGFGPWTAAEVDDAVARGADELLLEGEWLESQENGEYLLCGVATVEGERYHDFTIRFAPENAPASQTPEDILAQEWAWYEFVF